MPRENRIGITTISPIVHLPNAVRGKSLQDRSDTPTSSGSGHYADVPAQHALFALPGHAARSLEPSWLANSRGWLLTATASTVGYMTRSAIFHL